MKRVMVAIVLGGIAMFMWSSLAHVLLPLGEAGVSAISSNEDALLASMHASLGEKHGFYIFPAGGNTSDAAAMEEYARKIAGGPSGILVYHPSGAQALAPSQLVTEFLSELLTALIAVVLLSQTRLETFTAKAAFVALCGVLAALPTNISYWNWYGFPTTYTTAYMSIQVIGFVVAGIVAAAVLKKPARVADAVLA